MVDLKQLAEQREKATIDKADLFDFYHDNWDTVVAELQAFQDQHQQQMELAARLLKEGDEDIKRSVDYYQSFP